MGEYGAKSTFVYPIFCLNFFTFSIPAFCMALVFRIEEYLSQYLLAGSQFFCGDTVQCLF